MIRKLLICFALVFSFVSSVFAASGYDESQRTERLGLSYYDGRPIYVVAFSSSEFLSFNDRLDVNNILDVEFYRLQTGKTLNDFGLYTYNGNADDLTFTFDRDNDGNVFNRYYFMYCVDGGEVEILSSLSGADILGVYFSERFNANLAASDVGVDVYDGVSGVLKKWVPLALAFGIFFFSTKSIRRYLFQFVTSAATNGGNFESAFNSARSDYLSERDIRKKSNELAQRAEAYSTAEAVIDDLTSGKAYGVEFSDKVVESNRKLHAAWNRLSTEDRRALLDELDDKLKRRARKENERFSRYRREVADLYFSGIDGYRGAAFGDAESDDEDDDKKTPF